MLRIRALLAVAMMAAIFTTGSLGQDKKDEKPAPKAKGQLPANWNKLGLTDEQKQKIYTAQSEYRDKISELQVKINDLKKAERAELEKVLTKAQKDRLKELLLEKAPSDKDAKKDKDKEPSKKADKEKE
jgi:Spy/CpxP family protein refolding chaperone